MPEEKTVGAVIAAPKERKPMAEESLPAPRSEARPAAGRGGNPFTVYKPGQGARVRWGTAAGFAVIALAAVMFVYDQLPRLNAAFAVRTLIPVLLLAGAAYLIFWLVGRKENFVDFLILTEGEMKKVNWSTRAEIIGSTRIVIVTLLALGFFLFLVDLLFIVFFSRIGVLKVDAWRALFGGFMGDGG